MARTLILLYFVLVQLYILLLEGPIGSPVGSERSVNSSERASAPDSASLIVHAAAPSSSGHSHAQSVSSTARAQVAGDASERSSGRSTVLDFLAECERADAEERSLAERTITAALAAASAARTPAAGGTAAIAAAAAESERPLPNGMSSPLVPAATPRIDTGRENSWAPNQVMTAGEFPINVRLYEYCTAGNSNQGGY